MVGERDLDACVQVGELTHAPGYDVPLEGGRGEDGRIGPELLSRTALRRLTDDLYGIEGLALLVFLLIDMPIAEDL